MLQLYKLCKIYLSSDLPVKKSVYLCIQHIIYNVLIDLPCCLLLHVVCSGEHLLYEFLYQIKYSILFLIGVESAETTLMTISHYDTKRVVNQQRCEN